jgi:MFS transporter, FHS family, Na+ dependent glucose transporter 1
MTTDTDRRRPDFRAASAWLRTTPASQSMTYYGAFIALGFAGAVLGPTLPGLAAQTRSQLSQISYLFTAHSLGYLIGSFAAGRFYDRAHLSGNRIMAGMLAIMAVMMCLIPEIPLLWLLTAAVLVLGSAEGVLDVGGNTLVVWVHGKKVGPFMNALHFAWGVGAFVAPVFVAQAILRSDNIAWAYWGLALLMVPPAIALLRVPSPAAPLPAKQEVGRAAGGRLLVLVVFFFFLFVGAEHSMGGWITSYGIARGLTAANAAYLASAFWGFFTLARALSIPMARLRPSVVLYGELTACLVGSVSLLLWPESTPVLWLGTILFGFGMAAVFPTTVTYASSLMSITGRVTSWFFVGASLGGMTIPWIIGQLFKPVGPQAVPLVVSCAILASIGMLLVLSVEARRLAAARAGTPHAVPVE